MAIILNEAYIIRNKNYISPTEGVIQYLNAQIYPIPEGSANIKAAFTSIEFRRFPM